MNAVKRLPIGKIPIDVLNTTVLKMTGARSADVITPPKAGLDFCAIRAGGGFLLVSADPITGVSSGIGRYAVCVASNDVATSGNRPQFAEVVNLLPEGADTGDLSLLARQTSTAAKEIGLAIVGGHTEVTPGLRQPIVIATVFSFAESYVTSEGAQKGDAIVMTKTAGLEGTAVLASELGPGTCGLSERLAQRASRFTGRLSVVDEAVAAFKSDGVDGMHDCTEGGVLGATYEMSLASGVGFELEEASVPVAPETSTVCERLGIDPLKLIGSGSLLIAVKSEEEERVKAAIRQVCQAESVGHFTRGRRVLLRADGSEIVLRSAPEDELWRALAARSRVRH